MDMQKFGDRLLELRQVKKLTQEELAVKLGVTSQAISKWERGLGLPDVELLCEISRILDISLDTLLEVRNGKITESGDSKEKERLLRDILTEPIKVRAGTGLKDYLLKEHERGFPGVQEIRSQIACDYGYLLPVVRIMDSELCDSNAYQILIYDHILCSRHVENIVNFDMAQMYADLKTICIDNYSMILNRQIVKNLIDNLEEKYPAVVAGVVPVKIPYAAIQWVLTDFIKQKRPIRNLIKIIEQMEEKIEVGIGIEQIWSGIQL